MPYPRAMHDLKRPVRLGIAGCGNVLGAYLAQARQLEQQGRATVAACCGRERQREKARREAPGAAFVTDYKELLARPDVDAVLILTPMTEHAWMARAALQAGKHVLVEKPLATTLAEAAGLLKLAQAGPGLLVPAPFTVLSPTFQAMAGRLRRGEIGRVVSARARYGWAGPNWNDWFYRPGGGALFDLGVYSLTTLTGWLGPVRQVTALTGVAVAERLVRERVCRVEAEDNAQVLLDFGDNCFAAVTTGFTLQQYRGPAAELYGTEGTLQMLGDDWDPDGYELWRNDAGCWQCFKEARPDWPWTDGLRHLVDCVREGSRPQITPEHAFHVLEVMIRAQEAGRDGKTRQIESRFPSLEVAALPVATDVHRIHDRTRPE